MAKNTALWKWEKQANKKDNPQTITELFQNENKKNNRLGFFLSKSEDYKDTCYADLLCW